MLVRKLFSALRSQLLRCVQYRDAVLDGSRVGLLLLASLCVLPTQLAAVEPAAVADDTAQAVTDTVEALKAQRDETREKLASGPSQSAAWMLGNGTATQKELDEWTLLLNLKLSNIDRHLAVLKTHNFEIQSRQETQAEIKRWSGFDLPPPYAIDFIDGIWSDLYATQEELETLQISNNLIATQIGELTYTLEDQEQRGRQAEERARRAKSAAAEDSARLVWLSELANARTQTTFATLGLYQARLKANAELQARHQLKADFFRRQIGMASAASPITKDELAGKLSALEVKRLTLEQELSEATASEQRAQHELEKPRASLKKLQGDLAAGDAEVSRNRLRLAQLELDIGKAKVETAMLRVEVLRLLMEASRGNERIWQARLAVAQEPTPAQIREIRALYTESLRRLGLWHSYLTSSLETTSGLVVDTKSRLNSTDSPAHERALIEALLATYQEREALYQRVLNEAQLLERLMSRLDQELENSKEAIPRLERLKDLANRAANAVAALWGLEVFSVQDTILVDGHEITGSNSITVGKITSVVLILTLGLWFAALASARVNLILRNRFAISNTAGTLLERGMYILSVVILVLVALDIVNIPLTVFAFMGGALAIGIGFGAQNLINNFVSGIIMLIERPISLGDLVEVEGMRGRVVDVGARSSRIRRPDGIDMLIPNSSFLEKNVTNLTLTDSQVRISVNVGVAYGSPLREVSRLLQQAVDDHGKVLNDPAPVILFEDFGDNALMFGIYFWVLVTPQADSRVVASDLRYMIERLLREAGIVIAFPQRDIHLNQAKPLEIVMRSDQPPAATVVV